MPDPASDQPALVLTDIRGPVCLITLNRPEALNALTPAMTGQLIAAVEAADADPEVRCIVLTGRGRAFCAGLDLKALASGDASLGGDNLGPDTPLVRALAQCRTPVIGAINGVAVTGGFELALACDFLYAAPAARFADTHGRVGLLPGWGLSQKLPRLVGINRAREISLSGRYFSAEQAEAWGLVNRVVPEDMLLETVLEVAESIAEALPEAVQGIKALINEGFEGSLADGLALEGERATAYNRSVDFSQMAERLAQLRQRQKGR